MKNSTENIMDKDKINLFEFVPYVSINTLCTIFGIFGNILIISAIILSKELHTVTSFIILNLSLADLMISCSSGIFALIGVTYGKVIFDQIPLLCKLTASACFIFCNVSFANQFLLAFNRFIYICHNRLYKMIFSKTKTAIYCILTWITMSLLDLPNILKTNGQHFERRTFSCMMNMDANKAYITCLFIITFITIGFLLPYFYYSIFKSIVAARSRTIGYNHQIKREQKFLYKSSKGLFYSFLFFMFTFLPYFCLIMIKDYQNIMPRFLYLYMFLFARANSVFNPILYSSTNSLFKRSFNRIFNYLICKKQTHTGYLPVIQKFSF